MIISCWPHADGVVVTDQCSFYMTSWPSTLSLSLSLFPTLSGQYDVMSHCLPYPRGPQPISQSAVPPLNLLTLEPSLKLLTCHLAIICPATLTTDTFSEHVYVCVCEEREGDKELGGYSIFVTVFMCVGVSICVWEWEWVPLYVCVSEWHTCHSHRSHA